MRRPLLLTGFALLLLGGPAAGQNLPTLPANGSELFRFALHKRPGKLPGLEPVTEPRDVLRDREPGRSIIIVLGNTDALHRVVSGMQLRNFVAAGGALLIATDGPNNPLPMHVRGQDRGWGETFGQITVTGRRLTGTEPRVYAGDPTRPYVRPWAADIRGRDFQPSRLFADLPEFGEAALATGSPSEMQVPNDLPPFRTHRLAGYARGTRVAGGGFLPPDRDNFAFALTTSGVGRMLVLADRDVFANGMMGFRPADDERGYRLDNANWEFANRTISWLQEGARDPRTKCLFIEDGRIIDKFADKITPPTPPIPNLPPDVLANILLNNANPIIDEAQRQNYFNRMVESAFGFDRIVRYFLVVCTILFLFFGVRWLRRALRKPEPAVGNPAREAAQVPRGGVVRQRTAAQIEVGNLYEAAARRIRDRFDVLGGRPAGPDTMPPVLVATDVPDAPILRHTVGWLWSIGYGEAPVAVPPIEWDRVNGLLERVTARAARGDWTFGADV